MSQPLACPSCATTHSLDERFCPKCGMPLPCDLSGFDVIDALRCPNCDALFERGGFVCYGAKSEQTN